MQFLFVLCFAKGVNWTLLAPWVFCFADFLTESDQSLIDFSPEIFWENLEELDFGLRRGFGLDPFESVRDSVQMSVHWDAEYSLPSYL
jgi:hypothetical protein